MSDFDDEPISEEDLGMESNYTPSSLLSSQSPLTSIYNNALLTAPSLVAHDTNNSALPAGALGGAGVVSAAVGTAENIKPPAHHRVEPDLADLQQWYTECLTNPSMMEKLTHYVANLVRTSRERVRTIVRFCRQYVEFDAELTKRVKSPSRKPVKRNRIAPMLQKTFPGDTMAWSRPCVSAVPVLRALRSILLGKAINDSAVSYESKAGQAHRRNAELRPAPSRSAEILHVFWSASALPILQEVESTLRKTTKFSSVSSSSKPTSAPFCSSPSSVKFPPYDVLVDEASNMILRVHLPFFDCDNPLVKATISIKELPQGQVLCFSNTPYIPTALVPEDVAQGTTKIKIQCKAININCEIPLPEHGDYTKKKCIAHPLGLFVVIPPKPPDVTEQSIAWLKVSNFAKQFSIEAPSLSASSLSLHSQTASIPDSPSTPSLLAQPHGNAEQKATPNLLGRAGLAFQTPSSHLHASGEPLPQSLSADAVLQAIYALGSGSVLHPSFPQWLSHQGSVNHTHQQFSFVPPAPVVALPSPALNSATNISNSLPSQMSPPFASTLPSSSASADKLPGPSQAIRVAAASPPTSLLHAPPDPPLHEPSQLQQTDRNSSDEKKPASSEMPLRSGAPNVSPQATSAASVPTPSSLGSSRKRKPSSKIGTIVTKRRKPLMFDAGIQTIVRKVKDVEITACCHVLVSTITESIHCGNTSCRRVFCRNCIFSKFPPKLRPASDTSWSCCVCSLCAHCDKALKAPVGRCASCALNYTSSHVKDCMQCGVSLQ